MMIRNVQNLLGKDSLIGHLITVAQQLGMEFSITSPDNGCQYIDSLANIFEFGISLRPEVGFCYANQREAECHTFEAHARLSAIFMKISQSTQPLSIFNHIGERAWTYVFVLMNPADVLALFHYAKPCDYFLSNAQGEFMLAANWHDFSFVQR